MKHLFNLIMHPLALLCKPDASTETKIKFKNKHYLLIGNMEDGGAIATKKQYEAGECSYAYLGADGSIRRFHKIIGTKEEITLR